MPGNVHVNVAESGIGTASEDKVFIILNMGTNCGFCPPAYPSEEGGVGLQKNANRDRPQYSHDYVSINFMELIRYSGRLMGQILNQGNSQFDLVQRGKRINKSDSATPA